MDSGFALASGRIARAKTQQSQSHVHSKRSNRHGQPTLTKPRLYLSPDGAPASDQRRNATPSRAASTKQNIAPLEWKRRSRSERHHLIG